MPFKIAILNLGVNNIKSVKAFFLKYGTIHMLEENFDKKIFNYDCLIIPGNGRFEEAIKFIDKNNTRQWILNFKKLNKKIIGICLGAQIMLDKSEESPGFFGLGLIEGEVKKIINNNLKLPLLGWYSLIDSKKNNYKNFFFNNGYFADIKQKKMIKLSLNLDKNITAMFVRDNIYGIQFHPEKSSINGRNIIDDILLKDEKF